MSLPPNKSLLKDYPNRVFCETGSYRGDAIAEALDAGFSRIISIEIDPEQIKFCKNRFDLFREPRPEIKLIQGNSAVCLWDAIKDINEPITFWLDSHSQWFEDEPHNDTPFPLLLELRQIARHPIKSHTLILDDILILTHPDVTGWSRKDIEESILQINPNYKFQYIANPVKNNLLIATV